MADLSRWRQPLAITYPTLTAEQQTGLRLLLANLFTSQLGKELRRSTGLSAPASILAADKLKQAFVYKADGAEHLLPGLFMLATEQDCDSIIGVCAELLGRNYSIADEAGADKDLTVRKLALDMSRRDDEVISRCFPEIQPDLLSEIRLREEPAAEIRPRRPKLR